MRNPTVKAGIWLGVLCVAWTMVMGVTGWYKHPTLLNLFWLVVLIEIGVLVWGLRQTAATTPYLGQLGNGTLIAVIGAAIIFCGSLLFTAVLYPHYFDEMCALQRQSMHNAGRSDAEIEAYLELGASLRTPLVNALMGVLGTVITGFIASLVIAAFNRKKQAS
jgi:hypothetical protein